MAEQKDIFGTRADLYPKITGGAKFNGNAIMAFESSGTPGTPGWFGTSLGATPGKPGEEYKGMVVQNYQIGYQQMITKLKGLNTNEVTAIVAPPNGTLTINSAITNATDYFKFIGDYGDVCKVKNNSLQVASGNDIAEFCPDQKDWKLPSLTLQGCLCSQIQLSQTIENLVFSSVMNVEFVALVRNTN